MNLTQKFKNNIIYAFLAQGISLCVSLLISLVVPKFLSIEDFAYWQLFIFYTNYVSISQLGIVDGLYLKLGGSNFEELDYVKIGSIYKGFALWQILLGIVISLLACITLDERKAFVFVAVSVYMIIYNMSRFLGYVFQSVNNTRWFSIASIIDRIIILVIGTLTIFIKKVDWKAFVIIYILGITVSLLYTWTKGKEIVFSNKTKRFSDTIIDGFSYAKIGIFLMISNFASNLILGIGRQLIESHWGIKTFGKVSFSFSIVNFFILFINQISLVLFPALRKVDSQTAKSIFSKLEYGFSLFSPMVYVIYIPVSYILSLWLPKYKESLQYLMVLMPICVFDGKMQMLYNTYLKVFMKEKILLLINLVSVLFSVLFCTLSVFAFENLQVLLICLVFVIALRSIVSAIVIAKTCDIKTSKTIFFDLLFAIFFIAVCFCFGSAYSFAIILVAYFLFMFFNFKNIKNIFIRKQEV